MTDQDLIATLKSALAAETNQRKALEHALHQETNTVENLRRRLDMVRRTRDEAVKAATAADRVAGQAMADYTEAVAELEIMRRAIAPGSTTERLTHALDTIATQQAEITRLHQRIVEIEQALKEVDR